MKSNNLFIMVVIFAILIFTGCNSKISTTSIKNSIYDIEYKKFGDFIILKPLTGQSQKISFQIKPINNKNQVWFGGFCGADGKGGIGLFVWKNKIILNIGDSCTKRTPKQFKSLELPFSTIKLNEWNKIKIVYSKGEYILLSINDVEIIARKNIPFKSSKNYVYFGTDPRHPGNNYNFNGEVKNLKY